MKDSLERLKKEFTDAIKSLEGEAPAAAVKKLQEFKVKFSGKKSEFNSILKKLGSLPPEKRPELGALANKIKKNIESEINAKLKIFNSKLHESSIAEDRIDYTLPGRSAPQGGLHPLTKVEREIVNIFSSLGFEFVDGPELEDDFHNFEALNIPKNHPARDMQDTLYISDNLLLRSHTSNAQIRIMEKRTPPIRVISSGRVYRSDYDPTHSPMFTQLECLLVDRNVTFADLKGTRNFFVKKMFGRDVGVRLRSSYFPFTEPSAEVDIECIFCRGKGCNVCRGTGWLEILGCGMVNPEVYRKVGYNPDEVTGYALGMGLERIAMLKYGINDMRSLFINDVRLLGQF